MTHAEKYAQVLAEKYKVEWSTNLDDDTYDTTEKVARVVLPPALFDQWRRDEDKDNRHIMYKYLSRPGKTTK